MTDFKVGDKVKVEFESEICIDYDKDGIKHLETLTPREALILLANGFVLINEEGMSIKFTEAIYYNIYKGKGTWFQFRGLLNGFTIHALPKEAGE